MDYDRLERLARRNARTLRAMGNSSGARDYDRLAAMQAALKDAPPSKRTPRLTLIKGNK